MLVELAGLEQSVGIEVDGVVHPAIEELPPGFVEGRTTVASMDPTQRDTVKKRLMTLGEIMRVDRFFDRLEDRALDLLLVIAVAGKALLLEQRQR